MMQDQTPPRKESGQPANPDYTDPMAPADDGSTAQSDSDDLNAQLQSALAESEKTKDALLRAMADAENIRRRAATDVVNAHKYAAEGFASNLLPVKDALEMALADKTSTLEQLRMGIELTLKNLAAAFEKAKITDVDPLNQKFDPAKHQAVSQVDSDQPANTVVQVFQKGYLLQDRVLRPAMVAVSKGGADREPDGKNKAERAENPVESKGI